jgi:hypothetical protein
MAVRSQPEFVVAFLIRLEDGIPVGLLAALPTKDHTASGPPNRVIRRSPS